MAKITGNEPAFPFWTYNEAGYGDAVVMRDKDGSPTFNEFNSGITIKQFMATQILAGLVTENEARPVYDYYELARKATGYAKSLIEALNDQEP